VELAEVGLQELQQQVGSIWQGKAVHEALHGPCHLQEYLYHHFAAAAAAAAAAALAGSAAAQVGQQEGDSGANTSSSIAAGDTASNSNDLQVDLPDKANVAAAAAATAAAAAGAAAGYQFYHALSQHRQASVAVDTMWQVLTGQLPEAVLLEQQRQLQHFLAVVEALQAAAASAGDAAAAAIPTAADTGGLASTTAADVEVGMTSTVAGPAAAGELGGASLLAACRQITLLECLAYRVTRWYA
jgi:hypothetical protein